jgi:hypothetical protein
MTIRSNTRRSRRGLALAVLGAAMMLPLAPSAFARPDANDNAADVDQQPKMSNADRLATGVRQYEKKQYEEAVATLQQVDSGMLGPRDQKLLADTLANAQSAAQQRKLARAEFEKGEDALRNNNAAEAMQHYKAASENKYADDGTRAKAREQMVLADSALKRSGEDYKSIYASAVEDYKAGRLEDAQRKFEQLRDAGFKPGWFQKSPQDYLNDVNARLARTTPPPAPAPQEQPSNPPAVTQNPPANEPAPAPTPPPAPTPSEVAAQPTPQPANQPAEQPAVVPQQPVTMQPVATSPADQSVANSQSQPEAPVAQPTASPGMDQQVTSQPPPQPMPAVAQQQRPASGKEAYKLAVRQYKNGDWIAARQNFNWAKDMGYKPGWFETSPDKYLAQMDAKEARDGVNRGAQMAGAQPMNQDAGAGMSQDQRIA